MTLGRQDDMGWPLCAACFLRRPFRPGRRPRRRGTGRSERRAVGNPAQSHQDRAVAEHVFPQEQQAVGNIDFNQELLTQVFTPYQGRILKAYASVGER